MMRPTFPQRNNSNAEDYAAINSKEKQSTLELPYASRPIQAPGNGSPERRKALTDISHTRNTPTKPSTKNSSFPTVPSNAIHALSVSNSNSRPKRDAQRKSAKLDFRDEIEYFKPPLEPPVHVSQFQTLNSSIDSVSLPRPSLKANSLKKKVVSSGVAYPLPPPVVYEPLMLGSKKSAPKPVVRLKSVVQPKRPLLLKKSETPLDISKVLSSSAAKRPSNSREEREMDRIMVEHEFSADTPKFVTSSIPSRKRKAFVFDSDSDSLSDDEKGTDNDLFQNQEVSLRKKKYSNDMPSAAMDVDELESNHSLESCYSNIFSDSDSESETSSIASSLDEDVSYMSDDDVQPAVKRVRTSSSETTPATAQNSIGKDDRPFSQFMEEEVLVEVTRNWKKYPVGSPVEIKAGGALWIDGEKTHIVISEATQEIMKKEGVWGKEFFIGLNGYVAVGRGFDAELHTRIAASKKDKDFHELLESGWNGKKDELEVLHLDDNPIDFNVENLQWNTHSANLLLKLSKGGGPNTHGNKFSCSTNINGKKEQGASCCTLLEARHAADILKFNNVDPVHQLLVFNHGLNFKYPSLQVLHARTHKYKNKPSHQGKAFKSYGIITLLDWTQADAGLKKAVEDSKFPFDSKRDVLVKYVGKNGKGVTIMFIIERSCFNEHILNQEVSLALTRGWVNITKDDFPNNGIHRLVLGLKTGDFKVGRHRVSGEDGKRDNRKRVLRSGNHASNMMDMNKKTAASTSQFDGIYWDNRAQRWKAQMWFSNSHVNFRKSLGYFGTKGDKATGEKEASEWREKVKENVERISDLLKDVTEMAEFKGKVNDEIEKLK